jgi:hypothetical protein
MNQTFDLPSLGAYANFCEVRTKLKSEGYDIWQLEGLALRRQIISSLKLRERTPARPRRFAISASALI